MEILVIDDDVDSRESVSAILSMLGHTVAEAASADEGLGKLKQTDTINLVLSDIKLPGKSGVDFLRELRMDKAGLGFDVVLFTGYATVETAVDALRLGAYDYLLKPVGAKELVEIISRVQRRTEIRKRDMEQTISRATQAAVSHTYQLPALKDQLGLFSETMLQKVKQALRYHDDRSIPVLIQGETGVGKEVIARLIHHGLEGDSRRPFIDINCAAITPSLFESELFGYEHGAFTGGLKQGQLGKFDAANSGTLFLDEIAEIPLEKQGILLRVIQEKEFYRVGGVRKIKTDVRIICATNIALEDAIQAGTFRKDLYYRLKVGTLYLPPLRQRMEEIVPLALRFLREFSQSKGKQFQSISPQAAEMLVSYSWQGNVRELRNVIEWAVFMHDATVLKAEHILLPGAGQAPLPLETGSKPDTLRVNLGEVIDGQVGELVASTLERCNGNKTLAAQQLGISRRKLYRLLEKLK